MASQPLAHIRPIKPQIFAGSQAGNWPVRRLSPAAAFFVDPADADLQPCCQLLGCQNVGRIQSIVSILMLQRSCDAFSLSHRKG